MGKAIKWDDLKNRITSLSIKEWSEILLSVKKKGEQKEKEKDC